MPRMREQSLRGRLPEVCPRHPRTERRRPVRGSSGRRRSETRRHRVPGVRIRVLVPRPAGHLASTCPSKACRSIWRSAGFRRPARPAVAAPGPADARGTERSDDEMRAARPKDGRSRGHTHRQKREGHGAGDHRPRGLPARSVHEGLRHSRGRGHQPRQERRPRCAASRCTTRWKTRSPPRARWISA